MCLLHSNELPLRRLFQELDGTTSGPSTFNGPIGKLIVEKGYLNKLPFVKFKKINCEPLPIMDRKVLSKDQQYLYDILEAVRTGAVSKKLQDRAIGAVHHARWLNLGSSCVRYYMSEKNPTKELKVLVDYVTKVMF